MLAYIARRFLWGVLIVILSSMLVFILVAYSGNPLQPLLARRPPPTKCAIDQLSATDDLIEAVGFNGNSIGRVSLGKSGHVANFTGDAVATPGAITLGPDGALWYTNAGDDSIGRIDPDGRSTSYHSRAIRGPNGITRGPDGALWFTNTSGNTIGRITTAGHVRTFSATGIRRPTGITAGPDGALWFTDKGDNTIGRITTAGAVTIFGGRGISAPQAITLGPDGALWFTDSGNDTIGRITTAGALTFFRGHGPGESVNAPAGITAGPGGAVWFANSGSNSIGELTLSTGIVTSYSASGINQPESITQGPDGALWFTNGGANTIGRITASGDVTIYGGDAIVVPTGITSGPGNTIWFTSDPAQGICNEHTANTPLPKRYWDWFSAAIHGNFQNDLNGNSISHELGNHLLVTLRLVIVATLLAIMLAIAVGVLTGVRKGKPVDHVFSVVNFLFLSIPTFVVGIMLKEFVAIPFNNWAGPTLSPGTHIVFYIDLQQNPVLSGPLLGRIPDYLGHMVMPVITLMLISYASWALYQRAQILEVLDSDYVRLARAKGLSRRRVLIRHALRNALIPVTTVVALDFAAVFGGAIITENLFSWQGMGTWFYNGVTAHDIHIVLAYLVVTATIVVIFNLFADILYAILDPRIRYV